MAHDDTKRGIAARGDVFAMLAAGLEALERPALLVDEEGAVVATNRSARKLTREVDNVLPPGIEFSAYPLRAARGEGARWLLVGRDATDRHGLDARIALASRQHGLTNAQSRVLRLVVRGQRNDMVAAELGLTRRTIEAHVTNILRALGAKSRAEAIAIVLRP